MTERTGARQGLTAATSATTARWRDFVRETRSETVGQISARQVRVASASQATGDLLPLFAGTDRHQVPMIDDERRLVGSITQSDVVPALPFHD